MFSALAHGNQARTSMASNSQQDPHRRRVGKLVHVLYVERDWSQAQLAAEADLSQATISKVVNGKSVNTATLAKVAEAFGMSRLELELMAQDRFGDQFGEQEDDDQREAS